MAHLRQVLVSGAIAKNNRNIPKGTSFTSL